MKFKLTDDSIRKYFTVGYPDLIGGLRHELFITADVLSKLPVNKNGGILEVGVLFGRFFILLNTLVNRSDRSIAIDVFEQQNLNVDKSGNLKGLLDQGDQLATFKNNIKAFDKHRGKNVHVLKFDSWMLNFKRK